MIRSLLRVLLRLPEGCGVGFGVLWRLGQAVGVNSRVRWPVHFTSTVRCPERVRLGRRTFPGDSPHCYIQANNGIIIGDDTNLGPGVGLISANHDLVENARHQPGNPLRLGRNCWVGMNAVILPEVILGDWTIVGAGSVVTKSFPDGYCVIAGNPARMIRHLSQEERSAIAARSQRLRS